MPTRGRPLWAKRFIDSVINTTSQLENVELVIYVDDDDTDSHSLTSHEMSVKTIIGPRVTMGAYNSTCYDQSSGEIIVLVNDDMIIQTRGWDEKLRELDALHIDGIYLAYGNDLFKKGSLCTFPILSKRTCELLIQPYHHTYRGAFIDYHLMDIFKRLEKSGFKRIFYLDDVVFEHLHYRTGKAKIDETYKARGRFDDDMLFISLKDVREASYIILFNAINKKPSKSSQLPKANILVKPSNLFKAFYLYSKIFLLDSQLPFKWRFFMWWWFGARYVFSFINISKS